MTLSPRPISPLVAIASFAFTVALLGVVSSGCEDKHIGRVCDLDVGDGGTTATGTTATLNGAAVECPTRICVLPVAEMNAMNTGALCTATCSTDDDCSDGETTKDPTSAQCKTGFACIIPTTVGDFCCEHMCVCKDFIDPTRSHATPVVCVPGQSMCKNVH